MEIKDPVARLSGVLIALPMLFAGCAQDPELWGPSQSPCVQLRCEAQGPCPASSPALELNLNQEILRSRQRRSSLALLPWERDKEPASCDADEMCPSRSRCLAGACWSSPRSKSELRHWFLGEQALAGALVGWTSRQVAPSQLRLESSLASEKSGVWAVYLGADWITPQGHPLGADLGPVTFVFVQAHGKGHWAQVRPSEDPAQRSIRLALPQGWNADPSWRWTLRCAPSPSRTLPLLRAPDPDASLLALRLVAQDPWPAGPCRVLVKIPGHAAFSTAWFLDPARSPTVRG